MYSVAARFGQKLYGDMYPIDQNGELSVPPVPGREFTRGVSMITWDSEILQSFAELTNITSMTLQSFDSSSDSLGDFTYQIQVGSFNCRISHYEQCPPPTRYYPWYAWTKEGLKI